MSIRTTSFQYISSCLALRSAHTWTFDKFVEPASAPLVPNVETFVRKFKNEIPSQTSARFKSNRDVALASSAPVVEVLIEESKIHG